MILNSFTKQHIKLKNNFFDKQMFRHIS